MGTPKELPFNNFTKQLGYIQDLETENDVKFSSNLAGTNFVWLSKIKEGGISHAQSCELKFITDISMK